MREVEGKVAEPKFPKVRTKCASYKYALHQVQVAFSLFHWRPQRTSQHEATGKRQFNLKKALDAF